MDNRKNGVMRRTDGVELKDHISALLAEIDKRYEQRFDAQEKATQAALLSAQLAVDKAEANTRAWQNNANEWRGAMDDREKQFVYHGVFDPVCARVDALEGLRDIARGKASQNALLLTAVGTVIAIILGLIELFVK